MLKCLLNKKYRFKSRKKKHLFKNIIQNKFFVVQNLEIRNLRTWNVCFGPHFVGSAAQVHMML